MRVTGRSGRARDRKGWTGWKNQRGAAAVELGLVMPILVLLLFGIIEFARAWNARQTLTDAAREGARVAVVSNGIVPAAVLQDSVRTIVKRSVGRAGMDSTASKLTITMTNVGGGGTQSAEVRLQYVYTPLFGLILNTPITMQTASVMRNE